MTEGISAAKPIPRVFVGIARVLGTMFVLFVLFGLPYAMNPEEPEGPQENRGG